MTALSDQCNLLRDWLGIGEEVYPDSVVTSWIRMAEEILSKDLRCKDMVQIDTGLLVDQRCLLPSDWRAMDFVRLVDGRPLRYIPRDDFYNPAFEYTDDQKNCYTLAGNYLIVGGINVTSGTSVEITYYQDIPPLGDEPSWLSTKYPTLFTIRTLHIASMYSIEDQRNALWKEQADELVASVNSEHALSKASGSRLTRRHLGSRRGFG